MVKLKNINVFIFAVILLLSGCAKMQYNYVGTYSQLDFPPLQQKVSVYVGDRMLIQGVEYKRVFLNVENTSGGVCYTIPHGRYGKVGEDSKKEYFDIKGSYGVVQKSGLCDPYSGLYIEKDDPNNICVVTVFGGSACYESKFSVDEITNFAPEKVQKTLLYSGKIGDVIRFTYTESRGKQGSVFVHDIEYNISSTNVVGYKGARIRIHEATNEQITYEVLNNFPDRS